MLRPQIDIPLKPSDKILVTLIKFLATILVTINVVEWLLNIDVVEMALTKYKMLLLSAFGLLIAISTHFLTKHPEHFNYKVPITEENALSEYSRTINAVRYMIVFILTALSTLSAFNLWERCAATPYVMLIPGIAVVVWLVMMYRHFTAKKAETKA